MLNIFERRRVRETKPAREAVRRGVAASFEKDSALSNLIELRRLAEVRSRGDRRGPDEFRGDESRRRRGCRADLPRRELRRGTYEKRPRDANAEKPNGALGT